MKKQINFTSEQRSKFMYYYAGLNRFDYIDFNIAYRSCSEKLVNGKDINWKNTPKSSFIDDLEIVEV